MNTPLTIEDLRDMELPVRLKIIDDPYQFEVLAIGDKKLFCRGNQGEYALDFVYLKNYQLAPKTKTIKAIQTLYVTESGWISNAELIDSYDFDVTIELVINEETGEIISREVSAE